LDQPIIVGIGGPHKRNKGNKRCFNKQTLGFIDIYSLLMTDSQAFGNNNCDFEKSQEVIVEPLARPVADWVSCSTSMSSW
jgi:hypothetical protein